MNQIATTPKPPPESSLLVALATEHGIEPAKLKSALRDSIFRGATDAELLILVKISLRYHLDPFAREIYGIKKSGGGMIPVVSVDGWIKLITRCPDYDGMDFIEGPEELISDTSTKKCPAWIECRIYFRDQSHPVAVREYLEECYVAPRGQNAYDGPWQTHPRRMLRWKALSQCGRVACGLSGIYDPDEAMRIQMATGNRSQITIQPELPPDSVEDESEPSPLDPSND